MQSKPTKSYPKLLANNPGYHYYKFSNTSIEFR